MATKTFDRSDGLVRTLGDFVLDERLLWVRMFARCISCLTILPPRTAVIVIRGSGILGTENRSFERIQLLTCKIGVALGNNFNISSKISFHLSIVIIIILYMVSIIEKQSVVRE